MWRLPAKARRASAGDPSKYLPDGRQGYTRAALEEESSGAVE